MKRVRKKIEPSGANPLAVYEEFPEQTLCDRVETCRFLLHTVGLLNDTESKKVAKRIRTWLKHHGQDAASCLGYRDNWP